MAGEGQVRSNFQRAEHKNGDQINDDVDQLRAPFSSRDRAIGDKEPCIPAARGMADGIAPEFDDIEPIAFEGRAQFERKIIEERPLMHRNDDLSLHLFGQGP